MESVDVIIPTFGDFHWHSIAERAIDSANRQTVLPQKVFHMHSSSLACSRNQGASHSEAEWLIFLDADDELCPHYIEEMLKGSGDVRQPSTLGIVNGVEDDFPVLIPPGPNFMVRNYLVIGCMVRRTMFNAVGGFRELPALEDWDLWIRLRLNGAVVGQCPKAIYRVHVSENSRNQNVELHSRTYAEIQSAYTVEWMAKFGTK